MASPADQKGAIPTLKDKQRKAAQRRGEDAEAAAAAVLRSASKVKLPTVAEIEIEIAAALASQQPSLLPEPPPTSAEAPPAAEPTKSDLICAARQTMQVMFRATFSEDPHEHPRAKKPVEAIRAAMACDENEILNLNSDSEGEEWPEEMEVAKVHYKHTLRRLKKVYPDELCAWTDDGVCEQGHRNCVCGAPHAKQPLWPWLLQQPASAYGWCECEHGARLRKELRRRWLWAAEQYFEQKWHAADHGQPDEGVARTFERYLSEL